MQISGRVEAGAEASRRVMTSPDLSGRGPPERAWLWADENLVLIISLGPRPPRLALRERRPQSASAPTQMIRNEGGNTPIFGMTAGKNTRTQVRWAKNGVTASRPYRHWAYVWRPQNRNLAARSNS